MKLSKIIAAAATAAIIALPLSAQALQPEGPGDCVAMEGLARVTMENRLLGIPVSKMMEIVEDEELGQAIVLDAYKRPGYTSPKIQQQAIRQFANLWATACYDML